MQNWSAGGAMRVAGKFTRARTQGVQESLQEGATTVMLRGVPLHISTDILLCKLDMIAPGMYDFVYVPRDCRRETNIALAFINFVDHGTAQRVFTFFQRESEASKGKGMSSRVCQANVQGLAKNLAYFLVKAGIEALENPHAPQVFRHGVRVPRLSDAVVEHVTMDVLREAWLEAKSNEARKEKALPGADGGLWKKTGVEQARESGGVTRTTSANGSHSRVTGMGQPRSASQRGFSMTDMHPRANSGISSSLPEEYRMQAHDLGTWHGPVPAGSYWGEGNLSMMMQPHGYGELQTPAANVPVGTVHYLDCEVIRV